MGIINELLEKAINEEKDAERIAELTQAKAEYENINTQLANERKAREADKAAFVKKYEERFKQSLEQQQREPEQSQKPKGIKGLFK